MAGGIGTDDMRGERVRLERRASLRIGGSDGRQPKPGMRILGIDDSPFSKSDSHVLVVGVLMRRNTVEGVLSTVVERDGDDATEKLAEMVLKTRFAKQAGCIILNSIMFAGLNVVDIRALSNALQRPVIAVVRKKPDMKAVEKALANVCCTEEKMVRMRNAGRVEKFGNVYAQVAGISVEDARKILARFKGIPEPVRLAHVIAGGIVRGESGGKV